ncbi:MAG: DUF4159 domain-containing protein, partial [Planctomycetia bacterium]|nr:DUF4159 domain-containing protein [Planctomycetia bacterium]
SAVRPEGIGEQLHAAGAFVTMAETELCKMQKVTAMTARVSTRRWLGVAGVFLLALIAVAALAQVSAGPARSPGERRPKVRNVIVMREIKFPSDWNTDPTAVPQFLFQMRERTGAKKRWKSFGEPLELDDAEIFRWPLLYLTGHDGFEFMPKERENIRHYVLNGGVIWADDCLAGASAFMRDFKDELKRIFPKQRLETISKGDPRFASMYWLLYEFEREPGREFSDPIPNLAMMIDGQFAVLVTMNDYGCAWEVSIPPTGDEPIGLGMHSRTNPQREKVYRFSANQIYYVLTH